MPTLPEAMILDLDGTLLDHTYAARSGLRLWLAALDVAPSDQLDQAWFASDDRWHNAWLRGEVSGDERRRRRLREFLPLLGFPVGTDDELDAVFAGCLNAFEASWTGFDDVDAGLVALETRGIRLAVLTNGSETQQNAKVAALGLTDRVGRVFTAEGLGAAKPDPTTYLAVCAHLGSAPGSTVHLGDNYDLDVLAPRTAGLRAIHLDRLDLGPYDETDRLTSLHQLDTWLAGCATIGS